jgi:hypothetical protein
MTGKEAGKVNRNITQRRGYKPRKGEYTAIQGKER